MAATIVEACRRDLRPSAAAAYVAAQLGGGLASVAVANLMFDLPAYQPSNHERSEAALWLGEVVATAGLLFTIACCRRSPGFTGQVGQHGQGVRDEPVVGPPATLFAPGRRPP
ncbi:MAG: hypothetical protein WCG47_31080 [Dermatophilaceae bacterium]